MREVIGPDRFLMIDANQKWEVGQAIEWMKQIAATGTKPWWIEVCESSRHFICALKS